MRDNQLNQVKRLLIQAGVFFFITMTSAQVLIQSQLEEQKSFSRVINKSGRQRMLSQKVLRHISQYILLSKKGKNLNLAIQFFNELSTSHRELKAQNKEIKVRSFLTADINKKYQDIDSLLSKMKQHLDCISKNCNQIEKEFDKLSIVTDKFLKQMESVVKGTELIAHSQLKRLEYIELGSFAAVAVLLLLFFFRVLIKSIKKITSQHNKLLEREKFLDKIENIAKVGGWELDLETGKISWSNGIYKIHELPVGSPPDKIDAINFYAQHERVRINECLQKAMQESKSFDEEFEFIDNKGVQKWVRSIGEPILGSDGKIKRLTGVFQDVTNRKKTEIELEESRRYLDVAMDGSGVGIWDWYLKDNKVIFNNHWADMLGLDYSSIKMELSTWQNLVHPEDIDNCHKQFLDYAEGRSPIYENIHRVRHEDGRWLYILSRGQFSKWNKAGKPTRFTGIHLDITERQKLQEDREFVLSSTNVGIWKWDILNNELFWGESMYTLYKIEKGDFEGAYEAWEHTLHEDYKEETVKLLNDAIEGKAEFDTTFAIRTKDGEVLYIGAKAKIDRDEKGNAIGVSGINWDKTKEHVSELEMKAYVKGLDKYAIITKTDERGIITQVNEKFIEISKYSEDELIGKSHKVVNSGFHSKDFFRQMWSVIRSGETWRGEICNKNKNGDFYWVDTTITPSIDVRGKVNGYLSFRYDITELKKAQLRLTESLNLERISKEIIDISDTPNTLKIKLEEVFKTLSNMRSLSGAKAGVLFVKEKNGSLRLVSGKEFNAKGESKIGDLFSGATKIESRTDFNKLIEAYVGDSKKFCYIPLKDDKHDYGFMIIELADDLTKAKSEEKFFNDISHPLSQLIGKAFDKEDYMKQRQIALHNSKLASVGELAAGVGHEVNNPLAIVKGYLQSITKKVERKSLETEYLLNTIDKMTGAAERIEKIVNGLRTFSRVDNDLTDEVPIVAVMEESIAMIKEIYAKEGVKVSLNIVEPEYEYCVDGNRGRIQQTVMNLIANAKDATEGLENRRIKIDIEAREEKYVVVSITDNGVGIAEAAKEKIFDAFFTTKEVNKGTGIGLSLAHSIVAEHEGIIELESELGHGATFRVLLPAIKIKRSLKLNQNEKEKRKEKEFLGLNVMLVDDEEGIRNLLEDFIGDVCASVTCFENGQLALNAYTKSPEKYDLIISDMQMPVMDGAALLENIRSADDKVQPGFVFMTGGVNVDFENNKYNKMIDGYLFKPFNEDDVYKTISSLAKTKKEKVA